MTKFLSIIIVAGINLIGATIADAMPAARSDATLFALKIPVTSGCGIGVHRGPFDGCYPRSYHGKYYRWYRHGLQEFPFVASGRYSASNVDPFVLGSGFCAYGSYVACVNSGAFCWQRCY